MFEQITSKVLIVCVIILTLILMAVGIRFLTTPVTAEEASVTDTSQTVDLQDKPLVIPTPEPTPAPTQNPGRSIDIRIENEQEIYEPGDIITFVAVLNGYEWCENFEYQWQVGKGEGWEDIPGANSLSYSFEVTEESYYWYWRIVVTCW